MLNRIETDANPIHMSEEKSVEILNLLSNIYEPYLKKYDLSLALWGLEFPQEVLLALSFLHNNQSIISCIISSDKDDKTLSETIYPKMLNGLGQLIDYVLSSGKILEDPHDLVTVWEPLEGMVKGHQETFHTIITLNNILLELEANRLLANS
jgi:hypothetical protein